MKRFLIVSGLLFFSFLTGQNQRPLSLTDTTKAINNRPVTFGQNLTPSGHIRCHTDEYEIYLRNKFHNRSTTQEFESWLEPKIAQIKADRAAGRNIQAVYSIPVVVHVIHNGDAYGTGENITDEQVLSQIQVLNEDYRKMLGTPGYGAGVDVEIEFCMAQTDPNGNPTDGIDRVDLGTAAWDQAGVEGTLKPNTIWDPDNYLNMWTARFTGDLNGVLGYAQFPSNSGLTGLAANGGAATTDGVIMGYNAFGSSDIYPAGVYAAPYDKGRTTTHEVGHWLGLRHIWGDGNCTVDDFCADTPVAGAANFGCPAGTDSCPTNAGNDMIENYMDYTDDTCMNIFTQDQKDRMVTVLSVATRRATLVASTACQAPAPYIKFGEPTGSINEGTNCNYSDYDFPVTIAKAATANADVTFTVTGGTATQNLDYSILNTSVTFPAGTTADQFLTLRVYNDGLVEVDETIQVELSVNANGGDALVNSGSSTMNITLYNDDFAPNPLQTITILEEDFEDVTGWTVIDQDGDGNNWGIVNGADGMGTAPNTITGRCAFSEKRLSYLGGTGNASPNNYFISPQISIPSGVNSATLSFIMAAYGANAGNYTVYFTTDASSEPTILAGTQLLGATTVANGASTLHSIDMTALAGQTGYLVFRHTNNNTTVGLLLLDTLLLETEIQTEVQTEVNNATRYEATIPTSGQVYASDTATNKIMTEIDNGIVFDYGCVSVEVDQSQTSVGAPTVPFVDTATQNYILSKTYFIDVANDTSLSNYTVSFYFTEAEVAAWETATGKLRSELKIIKVVDNPISVVNGTNFENYTIEEIPVTIGSFGTNVVFSAAFSSKLRGGYAVGPATGTVCGDLMTTWDGTAWSNGVPTKLTAVTFSGNYSSSSDIEACTVTVIGGADVVFNTGNSLIVTGKVTVDSSSSLTIENNASLIQKQDVANSGIITVKRDVSIRKLDYVYWSTPVADFSTGAISVNTPGNSIWKWIPTVATHVNGYGSWTNGNETMTLGKGYIVRGPDNFDTTLQTFTANFVGVPNNGTIAIPIERGTYTGADYNTGASGTLATNADDNWNLIGNPYPSAISAIDFLTANTNIDGFINIWTHGTNPNSSIANPFYGSYAYNYSVNDYITYNALGASSGPATFNGNIASGQSFFVKMSDSSISTTENVTFTNGMRNKTYLNDQFFRNAQPTAVNGSGNSIWLDLVSTNSGEVTRTLIGYVNGAQNGIDRLYDAPTDNKKEYNFYSLINDQKMVIQGKGLPFLTTDVVPLGLRVPQDGNYTIAIGAVEGLFADVNQSIYLEDAAFGIIHDLKNAPYSFTTTTGVTDNRFTLRYTTYLSNEKDELTASNVWVNTDSGLTIHSSKEMISTVDVFDVLGRSLAQVTNASSTAIELTTVMKNNTLLIVQITLENGKEITKKIMY
ncbi:choice-of-anchor J domain-containing protein [Flavobacterium sp. NRK F10]|uniref:choice-of-anchor J domain-containing protein n=1 Tax=Flavobacterium sp. NRK F10 TaxID=2954931 RepID=UPI002091D015|nr:choice-of-anchor J domain-containing protein [Flavobacterium sp. NRK F10]MCO6174776.1 choice-of-anchor J domain-containing protein [Flavobacterium sp. NRK F10]